MLDAGLVASASLGALLGGCLGLLTGLVPGLHTNNVAQGLLAGRVFFLAALTAVVAGPAASSDPSGVFAAAGFLLGLAIGHSFTDEIPAVFLGAPDPETALSVLPGHRLLMAGLGPAAVRATAVGSALGILFGLPLVPLLAAVMGPPIGAYSMIGPLLPALLVFVAAVLVLSERGRPPAHEGSRGLPRWAARLLAAGLLLLSGALGELVVFQGLALPNFFPLGQPLELEGGHLLSLFAGLFGLPTLLLACRAPAAGALPSSSPAELPVSRRAVGEAAAVGTLSGALVGWLPGVGAAQATVLSKVARDFLHRKTRPPDHEVFSPADAATFLVTQASVGTANILFNLVALFSLLRVRSGAMSALQQVGGDHVERWQAPGAPPDLLLALLIATALCLPLCFAGALALGRACSRLYARAPPRALSAAVFVFLLALILAVEGVRGLAVAACGLLLGLIPPLAGVKRVHLMGAILVPVVLRLLGGAP